MKFTELKALVRSNLCVTSTREVKQILKQLGIEKDLRKRAHWESIAHLTLPSIAVNGQADQDDSSELDRLISFLAMGGCNRQYLEDIRLATSIDEEVLIGYLLKLERQGDIVLYPLNEGHQHWPKHVYAGMAIKVPGAEWQDYRRILYWVKDQRVD